MRTERRLALHSVVSEEDGGLGAFATLRRGHRGEVAVITEPTSGRLVTANAGALTFRIEVTGRAAHGSTRQEGVSALEAFWPVHLALRELEARRNADPHPLFGDNPLPYGISVGTVRTGDWASSVPDLLVAEGRMGVRLDEDPALARAAFEDAVAAAAAADPWLRDHPPRVTLARRAVRVGRLPEGHALVGEVADAVEVVSGRRPAGGAPRPTAATCGSTPGSAASRRCTTARATSGSRTPRASRCRSPRWCRWPGRWPWWRPAGSAPTESVGQVQGVVGRERVQVDEALGDDDRGVAAGEPEVGQGAAVAGDREEGRVVLTDDEKELGVALVDIGGGTTDIAIYERGSIWHTAVIGVGGDHFTNDIAVGLRTPVPDAEKIERKCGCALSAMVDEDETMEVASVGGRKARVMARRTSRRSCSRAPKKSSTWSGTRFGAPVTRSP